VTARIALRPLNRNDEPAFLAQVQASRALHHPWADPPSTPTRWHRYLEWLARPENAGFAVCRRGSEDLAGVIHVTNIVRGIFQSGYLDYFAFAGHERRGLMKEGLSALVRHAFRTMKLHRLEANIQPANAASIALVRACGFAKEGYSPRYLKIGGRWRDHERWAIVAV